LAKQFGKPEYYIFPNKNPYNSKAAAAKFYNDNT